MHPRLSGKIGREHHGQTRSGSLHPANPFNLCLWPHLQRCESSLFFFSPQAQRQHFITQGSVMTPVGGGTRGGDILGGVLCPLRLPGEALRFAEAPSVVELASRDIDAEHATGSNGAVLTA